MKKLIIILSFSLLLSVALAQLATMGVGPGGTTSGGGGGSISFTGACTGQGNASAVTFTLTCSPSNGSQFVMPITFANTVTVLTCHDNNLVSLNIGSTGGTIPNTTVAYYVVSGSPTSFICAWTTARATAVNGVWYTGNSSINASATSNTASGTSSATVTVSPVSTVTNDFMVGGCSYGISKTWTTPKTGNERVTVTSSNSSQAVLDNTSGGTSGSPVTLSDTVTVGGNNWSCSSVELKP